MGTSDIPTAAAIVRLMRKGAWTGNPDDVNYANHWNNLPMQPGERLVEVVPGAATIGGVRTPVNMRVTESERGPAVYVDTPNLQAIGQVAGAANALRRLSGAATPRRYEGEEATLTPAARNRVTFQAPDLSATGRLGEDVSRRPTDMGWREQLSHAWRYARG